MPSHFNFTIDSDGDHLFPHSPTQTVTHALRLGNLEALLTPITQISAIHEEGDPNNDTPTPDPLAPELLHSQQLLHGESLERWLEADPHPDLVVLRPFNSTGHILGRYKRQREEPEQEEAPRKKRTHKQYKGEIYQQEDNNPAPIINKHQLHPQASLQKLRRYLWFPFKFNLCNMTSLPASLAAALTAIASQSGDAQVVNVFTELPLYLEHNKDQLDMANAKNVQLRAELNQVCKWQAEHSEPKFGNGPSKAGVIKPTWQSTSPQAF